MSRRKSPEILIAAVTLAIAVCWLPIRMRFPFDDTYITFRYAANVAHGFGIVWNPGGAHTEGYTNFLFMLLLAPFSAMGWDLVAVSQAIGVIAVIVSAIAIYRIADDSVFGTRFTLLAPALFLLDPFIWINAFSGLETSLFTMWLLLAVAAVASRRNWTAAFCFATLATLTRPEGALMGGILFLAARWSIAPFSSSKPLPAASSFLPLRAFIFAFVLPLVLYAVWKWVYFGNLLPNSFYVKVAQPHGPGGSMLPGFWTMGNGYRGIWYLGVLAGWGIWAVARYGWRREPGAIVHPVRSCILSITRTPELTIPILWTALLTTFYLFSHLIQPEYQRFTSSIEAMALVVVAVAGLSYPSGDGRMGHWPVRLPARYILLLVGILMVHVVWSLYPRKGLSIARDDSEFRSSYMHAGQMLATIPGREHITLAWSDAGRLPYLSGFRHIDPIGLNTNEIAHAHSAEEVIDFVLESRPDLIVIPLLHRTPSVLRNGASAKDSCRAIIPHGGGLLDTSYPVLAARALAAGYRPIVMVPQTIYDLDFLADTASLHYHDIVGTLVPRIGRDSDFLPPPACIRPAHVISRELLLFSLGRAGH